MKKIILILFAFFVTINSLACKKKHTNVIMKTSLGDIHIELFNDKSPETVKNFLLYIDNKFYNGTIFHRVMPHFMIQGGGFTEDMEQKPTNAPIKNEATNGLKNTRGTIAMARTNDIHSATSQFFINVKDNYALDHGHHSYGYCVFGKVTRGMDVVDAIKNVPTQAVGFHQNVPVEHIKIISITRIKK